MTQIPGEDSLVPNVDWPSLERVDAMYPTEWHVLDEIGQVEYRQHSDDTHELRSPTHSIILNTEGFNLYLDNTLQGQVIFEDWCTRHNIEPTIRTDLTTDEVEQPDVQS